MLVDMYIYTNSYYNRVDDIEEILNFDGIRLIQDAHINEPIITNQIEFFRDFLYITHQFNNNVVYIERYWLIFPRCYYYTFNEDYSIAFRYGLKREIPRRIFGKVEIR
jgi:hypothetical protein